MRRTSLEDADHLGPLHQRDPQVFDADFRVVHGPLPTVQTDADAFMADLTMGPGYQPRREHAGAGYRLTGKERRAYIVWAPAALCLAGMVAYGAFQVLTQGRLAPPHYHHDLLKVADPNAGPAKPLY